MWLLAYSLPGWSVPMFLHYMSLLEVCVCCRLVSSTVIISHERRPEDSKVKLQVTLEDIVVLNESCPVRWDSCLNLVVLVFVCIAVPGIHKFQYSLSERCSHILMCVYIHNIICFKYSHFTKYKSILLTSL